MGTRRFHAALEAAVLEPAFVFIQGAAPVFVPLGKLFVVAPFVLGDPGVVVIVPVVEEAGGFLFSPGNRGDGYSLSIVSVIHALWRCSSAWAFSRTAFTSGVASLWFTARS